MTKILIVALSIYIFNMTHFFRKINLFMNFSLQKHKYYYIYFIYIHLKNYTFFIFQIFWTLNVHSITAKKKRNCAKMQFLFFLFKTSFISTDVLPICNFQTRYTVVCITNSFNWQRFTSAHDA